MWDAIKSGKPGAMEAVLRKRREAQAAVEAAMKGVIKPAAPTSPQN